jgi:release factor glutamine methyltransferase
VYAEDEAALLAGEASSPAELAGMVARRAGGEPLEQVVGWAEFCGLRISLEPGVFVPRRRSEFLVRQAAGALGRPAPRHAPDLPVIIDMCCGSGAIGLAIAIAVGGADLHAVDVDDAAVRCARANLAGQPGCVYQGDMYGPLPERLHERVNLIVANAPYVPSAHLGLLPAEARRHEPRAALDGGADGVALQRRVAAGAPRWLAPGGCLLIETSDRQAVLTAAAVAGAGLTTRIVADEERGSTAVLGERQ